MIRAVAGKPFAWFALALAALAAGSWACSGRDRGEAAAPCAVSVAELSSGRVPAEALLTVLVLARHDGAAVAGEERCARACAAKVQVAFDGAVARSPLRFHYDFGRAGWTSRSEPYFLRTGLLRSRCDDPDPAELALRLEDPGGLPGTFVYESHLLVPCECDR